MQEIVCQIFLNRSTLAAREIRLKKVTDAKISGACADDVYTSSWGHYEILDKFLRTQVVPRKSQTNLVSTHIFSFYIASHCQGTSPLVLK
jgi:hypothetical protein